jgi:S1/P1 Nuclease
MKRLIVLALLLSSQLSLAWGPEGHMIVAQIGQNNLTPQAKKAVQKLLGDQSMADVSTWADVIKGKPEWSHTKGWHFVDIPDGQNYGNIEHAHDGDAVTAITGMVAVLKDPKATSTDKGNALKFIIHFVGDIHQPLHVGRPEDRGGNSTQVTFEGRKTNLHALWDSILLTKSPMDYEQYATSLDRKPLFAAPYDLPEFSFTQVINECMGARKDIYNFHALVAGDAVLDKDYYQRNLNLMNTQLLQGGKRLASLINMILK